MTSYYKTVYDYHTKWEKDGVAEAIHDALRGRVREAAGRGVEPSAAILDSQTIRTSSNVRGIWRATWPSPWIGHTATIKHP
jgi:transposase